MVAINLSHNLLTSLPATLPLISHISKLDLSKNQLTELPENFGQLRQLRSLDLYANKIEKLPVSFAQLKSLKWLDLKDNPLCPALRQVNMRANRGIEVGIITIHEGSSGKLGLMPTKSLLASQQCNIITVRLRATASRLTTARCAPRRWWRCCRVTRVSCSGSGSGCWRRSSGSSASRSGGRRPRGRESARRRGRPRWGHLLARPGIISILYSGEEAGGGQDEGGRGQEGGGHEAKPRDAGERSVQSTSFAVVLTLFVQVNGNGAGHGHGARNGGQATNGTRGYTAGHAGEGARGSTCLGSLLMFLLGLGVAGAGLAISLLWIYTEGRLDTKSVSSALPVIQADVEDYLVMVGKSSMQMYEQAEKMSRPYVER